MGTARKPSTRNILGNIREKIRGSCCLTHQTKIEKDVSYKNRLTPEPYLSELIKDGGELSGLLAEKKQEIKEKSDPPRLGICDDFNQINLFTIMGKQRICLILKLWEIMMLNECLLILADTPVICR